MALLVDCAELWHTGELCNGFDALTLNTFKCTIYDEPITCDFDQSVRPPHKHSPVRPQKHVLIADRKRDRFPADIEVGLRQIAQNRADWVFRPIVTADSGLS